jgi:hypothetical protein
VSRWRKDLCGVRESVRVRDEPPFKELSFRRVHDYENTSFLNDSWLE